MRPSVDSACAVRQDDKRFIPPGSFRVRSPTHRVARTAGPDVGSTVDSACASLMEDVRRLFTFPVDSGERRFKHRLDPFGCPVTSTDYPSFMQKSY